MATVSLRTRSHSRAGTYAVEYTKDDLPGRRKRRRIVGPTSETNFRPQPGDIIIRQISHADQPDIVSVMGVLRIYADDYYFMYEDGQTHLLKFSFRSGDRILRFGRFTSRFYTWKNEELESLYLLHAPPDVPPTQATEWYKVAEHRNGFPEPRDVPYHGTDLDITAPPFTVLADDFIIHKEAAEAPDRPWGLSYELRRATCNYDPVTGDPNNDYVEFVPEDIVIRVRMTNPPVIENDTLREDMLELLEDILELDDFVPMYVHGWLCLGGQQEFWPWTTYRWRYLGMDHHIFRNYQIRAAGVNRGLKKYDSCPALPGDVVVNTDERILPGGIRGFGRHSSGHVLIFRDDNDLIPLGLPGSMIIRFGRFTHPLAPAPPPVVAVRQYSWPFLQNDFSIFYETPLELIIHDQLTETGWVEAKLQRSSGLANMSFEDRELEPQVHIEWNVWDQPEHPLNTLYPFLDVQPHERDVVVNKNPHWANELLFSRHFKHATTDGDEISAILENDDDELFEFRLLQPPERTFNCFFWSPDYVFRHGDCLIKYFFRKSMTRVGRWMATVQLFQYQLIPAMWKPEADHIWVYRGQDTACLPIEGVSLPDVMDMEDLNLGDVAMFL